MKSKILITFLMCSVFYSYAQLNINGSFNVLGEIGVSGTLSIGSNAELYFQDGSTLIMLGTATSVQPQSKIYANTNLSQTGTGRILFAGSSPQTLQGGNNSPIGGAQPSFINIALDNSNGLSLLSSNTRVTSSINLINGHILIGGRNLELATDAIINNANQSRYIVTNSNGFLAKEFFTSAFTFPVGRSLSDYTPAIITPSILDNFFVNVKNYSESASDERVITDGVDRTWNIFSSNGVGANIALQHNNATNGITFNPNDAFVTQYQGMQWITSTNQNQGVWEVGMGANGVSSNGTISGSTVRDRSYAFTATTSSANLAFFSKSSNLLTPLPIFLLNFDAKKKNLNKSLLTWTTSSEVKGDYFEIESSLNGFNWFKIGKVSAIGSAQKISEYQFIHDNPSLGYNYYRLKQFDINGYFSFSPVKTLEFIDEQSYLKNNIGLFPNPVNKFLNIIPNNAGNKYSIINSLGKSVLIVENNSIENQFQIDLSSFPSGVYQLKVTNIDEIEAQFYKFVIIK